MAMLVSILLHIGVYFALDRMKIALSFETPPELNTSAIHVHQVEALPIEPDPTASPETRITPPTDAASLLDEVDLLAALPKNREIDIKPEIEQAEYALQMKNPTLQGDPAALAMEVSAALEITPNLPELGRTAEPLKAAEIGQVTVDPGAVPQNDDDLGQFTKNLIKQGARGNVTKGALDGVASLDDLLGLPPNILLAKKTLLPSDLLFEFNSDELRESAKVGLMKLALLIDRNPSLYCWIEGHTDLVGGDDFNLDLSIRRSEAVKHYLIQSLRMDASKISTRGFGRSEPLVTRGTADEQAANRRVEIRMRLSPPPKNSLKIAPKKAVEVTEIPASKPQIQNEPPPKAVLVKPKRARPVEESPAPPRAVPVAPRAAPAGNLPSLPDVPKATPVDSSSPSMAPRAKPVHE
jgi:outer membrane protein OmpA-like peptidoglycan-associated protein